MNNLTLALVITVFFLGLALYFCTLPKASKACLTKDMDEPGREEAHVRVPAILRCNVAVSRLVQLERQGFMM